MWRFFMKRESLITNTEKLLFDILEQQKKIEQILIDYVVKSADKNSCNCSGNCSEKETKSTKPNEKLSKPNEKKNVKPKKKG